MIKEILSFFMNVEQTTDQIKGMVKETIKDIEYRAEKAYRRLQKKVLLGLLEIAFVFMGIIFLIIGFMIFLHKYIGFDVILLVSGALLLYVALLIRLSQR